MRRILCGVLALLLTLSLAACSTGEGEKAVGQTESTILVAYDSGQADDAVARAAAVLEEELGGALSRCRRLPVWIWPVMNSCCWVLRQRATYCRNLWKCFWKAMISAPAPFSLLSWETTTRPAPSFPPFPSCSRVPS